MRFNTGVASLFIAQASAFPWVASHARLSIDQVKRWPNLQTRQAGSEATCPNNPNHTAAVPITAQYPYCGAKGGIPGNQTCTNNLVPAKGDTAHYYTAPGSLDIRGPCPGLNTAANHNFLSHDGITNFTELVDMQQNVYGVGYDLAVLLATLGVGLDGDPVTTKLSIGCDATPRTSLTGATHELGLDGHNKFEGDTSLTRNDYFLANGDNFSFNKTLYAEMSAVGMNNFNRQNMAKYRYLRYQQSLRENGNFYYGPKSLLLYGAASFVYELFPSKGEQGSPTQANTDYFFIKEQLPPNWYSRVDPYTIFKVGVEIVSQYQLYPVAFGGNTGKPNSFVGFGEFGPYFSNNTFNGTVAGAACALYQFATENVPSSLGGGAVQDTPTDNFKWAAKQLNPLYSVGDLLNFGCPLAYNSD